MYIYTYNLHIHMHTSTLNNHQCLLNWQNHNSTGGWYPESERNRSSEASANSWGLSTRSMGSTYGCFQKIGGFPPKSSVLIGFSIINHPFWGTTIFGNTHSQWSRNNQMLEWCFFYIALAPISMEKKGVPVLQGIFNILKQAVKQLHFATPKRFIDQFPPTPF